VLTAIAVILGVAMITGTYIETDQIRKAFENITADSVSKLDVVVSPEEEFTSTFGGEPATLDASLLGAVRRVPGVDAAEVELAALGNLVVDDEVVETFGAPGLVMADALPRFDPSVAVAGRDPVRSGEATVLEQNAEDHGIEIGDRIGVVTRHGVMPITVVGITAIGDGGSAFGGATVIELTRSDVETWFDLEGRASSISVIAEDGVDPAALARDVAAVLPPTARAQTASENSTETADEINDQIGAFLTPALLALAGASVLVGAFIIFNTFSITVAQRMREFAMLRALGATRAQVLAIVAAEALAMGLVASVLGIAVGIGVAKGLNALFDAVGFGIPRSGLILAPRTIGLALAVGVGVTLIAALVPAVRAMRVAPVAAIAGASAGSTRGHRASAIAAVLFLVIGAALAAQGLFGSGPMGGTLESVAGGAVLMFIGVALSARYLVRPLASVIGFPIERAFHTTGRLARENAERNPGRTAVTSAALMVGLGLVVFVAVFAAGLKSSFTSQIDDLVRADIFVYGQGFQPLPARTAAEIDGVDGVRATVPQLFDQLEVNGEKSNSAYDLLIGVDPARLTDVYSFDWLEGDDSIVPGLGLGEVLVEEQFAEAHGLEVGDTYEAVTPSGGRATLTAVGIYRDPTILQGSLASVETLRSISPARDPIGLLVALDEGADLARVQAAIEAALEEFPTAQVENRAEYQDTLSAQLDQIVYLLYALLAMSVLISLFGIANSLFLSIHERTSELGVLRAIGTTAGQVRRMIRYESVITAVIGGVLGICLGVIFAWLLIEALSEFNLELSIPVGQLAAFLLLSVIVGVVGSIAPARRASRVDVLEAIEQD
jgi:putative ABC transport system permease protein